MADVVLFVEGEIARSDIPGLCDRLRGLVELSRRDQAIICDVGALTAADAIVVDALARMQLTAQRLGRQILVRCASPHLKGLVALVGLGEVLPCCEELSVEPKRQSEQREQRLGVEERVEPDDPTV